MTKFTESEEFWLLLDRLVDDSELIIDRPKGSRHPKFDFIYEVDYGYLANTLSGDGLEIDVWLGTASEKKTDAIICTIDLVKRDSEIKLLIGCTEDEKDSVMRFHNESEFMKGIMIRRLNQI